MPDFPARRPLVVLLLAAAVLLAVTPARAAEDHLLTREAFLTQVFGERPVPPVDSLWLVGEIGELAREILGHEPAGLRQRYWRDGDTSAWIIDEIGKERPITIGVGVHAGRIAMVRILTYREPRGWEVRHDFFTEQFDGATLGEDGGLDRRIDGIAGATLSVRAVRKVSELALALHQRVTGKR